LEVYMDGMIWLILAALGCGQAGETGAEVVEADGGACVDGEWSGPAGDGLPVVGVVHPGGDMYQPDRWLVQGGTMRVRCGEGEGLEAVVRWLR
jgi:hypothetical protein